MVEVQGLSVISFYFPPPLLDPVIIAGRPKVVLVVVLFVFVRRCASNEASFIAAHFASCTVMG